MTLRILHIAPSIARRDGGPSEVLRGLIPKLEELGAQVTLLSSDKGASPGDEDLLNRDNVVVSRSVPPRSWNFAPGLVRHIWSSLGTHDVVHVHSVNSFTSTVTMTLARVRQVPYILEPHGAFDAYHMAQSASKKRLYNKLIDRFGFSKLSGVFTSSELEMHDARAIVNARNFELPLGVDDRLFELVRNPGRQFRVLYLGRITQKKRLDLVLLAIQRLSREGLDVQLDVAGPLGSGLKFDPHSLAHQLGITQLVTFHGAVNAAEREQLLSTASCFVLASEDESFGVAAAEAMAAGCPVVASDRVGIAKPAADNGALVLTKLDAEDLAANLSRLLRDPANTHRIGAAGRAYAAERFRWSQSARAALDAYKAVTK